MRRRDVGRGRRLRPGFTRTPGSGASRLVRAARASGNPVRDPTAPYYGGAAPSGARVGARERPDVADLAGCKLARRRRGRPRPGAAGSAEGLGRPKSPNVPERSGRGEQGPCPKGGTRANRGDAERLLKN